jgi:phosphoribosylglycinamide formyltransferase-1
MSGVNKNIVILISGSGSNMAAIVKMDQQHHWSERFGARVAAVLSNKADAQGLAIAREQGIATAALDHKAFASRDAFDVDLVVLAASRILTPARSTTTAG